MGLYQHPSSSHAGISEGPSYRQPPPCFPSPLNRWQNDAIIRASSQQLGGAMSNKRRAWTVLLIAFLAGVAITVAQFKVPPTLPALLPVRSHGLAAGIWRWTGGS